MKILHTADWHLGNNFHGYDRTMEHRHFLQWLMDALRKELPDVLIVAGDVFDTANPSAAAEGLLYDFLLKATETVSELQIVVIAGNHDSAGRLDAPAELLKRHNIYVRGTVRRNEDTGDIDFDNLLLPLSNRLTNNAEIVCFALPYLRPYDYPSGMTVEEGLRYYFENMMRAFKKTEFKKLPVVSAAHFYAAGAEICSEEHSERLVVGGQDCVSSDIIGKGICYTALGHIHRCQQVESNTTLMYYSGSALPMSFTERGYQHGVQVVEIDEEQHVDIRHLEYFPLRKLLTIPHDGEGTVDEVFDAIDELPKREKGDSGDAWAYLEIRLLEEQPEPTLLHDITEALSDKAVHFCRMVRVLPETKEKGKQLLESHRETLQSLSPLEMAHRVFMGRYHGDMPEELEKRFNEAVRLRQESLS